MEQFNLAFIRCVLAGKVSLEDVLVVMQPIFRDLGFREMISPLRRNREFYPEQEYFSIRREEEALFSKMASSRLSENDTDMQLKLIAENYAIRMEMKWKYAEDYDEANQNVDPEVGTKNVHCLPV